MYLPECIFLRSSLQVVAMILVTFICNPRNEKADVKQVNSESCENCCGTW